jgi:hypothetical protein
MAERVVTSLPGTFPLKMKDEIVLLLREAEKAMLEAASGASVPHPQERAVQELVTKCETYRDKVSREAEEHRSDQFVSDRAVYCDGKEMALKFVIGELKQILLAGGASLHERREESK